MAALLSVGVWLLEGGSYLLLSRGVNLGLPASLELPGVGLALVTINLGIMVPSGPGYVGTQEFFGTAALANQPEIIAEQRKLAVCGECLPASYIYGLIFRPKRQVLDLGIDSIVVLVLCIVGIVELFTIAGGK